MRGSVVMSAAVFALVGGLAVPTRAGAAPPGVAAGGEVPAVWTASMAAGGLSVLAEAGVDTTELGVTAGGGASVEVILTPSQAARVRAAGVPLAQRTAPAAASRKAAAATATPQGVFRRYGGAGGIAEEMRALAREHPDLAKLESIGKTVRGQDILVVKVTRDAGKVPDGARPGTLYLGAQHAREWITPEMVRRLMRHLVTGYRTDPQIAALVDTTELWFLPVANPDGYDYTFSGEQNARWWRKNLRDNDGDGKIATGDGVDLNRNLAWRWGWDDEGSSPDPIAEVYRGPAPDSEPESKALNALEKRVRPRLAINFHSAAEVLMYGVGWQTATSTPDDAMYRAMTGDPAEPAVPGYYPQVLSNISTANGDSAGQAVNAYGVGMLVDEMASCQTAADSDPTDAWNSVDCPSSFDFPDDERLIQAEFQRNLPFAMSVARSAPDPARPVSVLGRTVAALTPKTFPTSYAGSGPQTVAVIARKSLTGRRLHYRINAGPERTGPVAPWRGGTVYGGTDNLWYDEYRGQVRGARPGDTVDVWFTGDATGPTGPGGPSGPAVRGETSTHFSYTVADRPSGDTLVLADEGAAANNIDVYTGALAGAGHPDAVVWDVARQGAPDALGVLSHFRGVVWEVADHRAGAATTLAVRDYLNEGGKLVKAGAQAAANDPLNEVWANTDDFAQYWLGADTSLPFAGATGFTGAGALAGTASTFPRPPATIGALSSISDRLPAARYPQFATTPAGTYSGVSGPFEPYAGAGMAGVVHADKDYARLARTVDLTGVEPGRSARLTFELSYDTEPGYDSVVFEAHTVGSDDWTTLPDADGRTDEDVPPECPSLVVMHPFLTHYLAPSGDTCTPTGTTGAWHRLTGAGGGWHRTTLDLSSYQGRQVEVAVSYISDTIVGGRGALVDDARLEIDGVAVDATDFESGLGPFRVPGAPAGSIANATDWVQRGALVRVYAALATGHGLTLGFGLESLPPQQRSRVLRTALSGHH